LLRFIGGPSALTDQFDDRLDFTDAFCAFLQSSISSVDAAELLLFLRANRDEPWSPADLAASLTPGSSLSESETARYLDAFLQRSLIARADGGRVRYQTAAEQDSHVETLARLYNERPVTLFRVIYTLRDAKIKTLADAFRIWRR
jgi:hypothetical protein